MSGAHRLRRRRPPARRMVPVAAVATVAAVLAVPGVALALFTSTPTARTASVTAATIGSPGSFTATATSSTAVNLTWTAPSNLTGYTLSQSTGSLAGCSATPSSGATSCTATGLSAGTSYTWTLTAVYNNWKGPSVMASATTFQVVHATALLKSTPDTTPNTASSTFSGVSTTSGAILLILVYRQASNGNIAFATSNPVTGTAVASGSSSAVATQNFNGMNNSHFAVLAAEATGTGVANGTVTVNFSAAKNVTTTIDVIQLTGDNTASPVAGFAVSTGSGTAVTGGSLSPGGVNDGEVFFVGSAVAGSMTTPAGYTVLDAPSSTVHGSWFNSAASASAVSTTLGTSAAWGTIETEIAHG